MGKYSIEIHATGGHESAIVMAKELVADLRRAGHTLSFASFRSGDEDTRERVELLPEDAIPKPVPKVKKEV